MRAKGTYDQEDEKAFDREFYDQDEGLEDATTCLNSLY